MKLETKDHPNGTRLGSLPVGHCFRLTPDDDSVYYIVGSYNDVAIPDDRSLAVNLFTDCASTHSPDAIVYPCKFKAVEL